MKHNIPTSWSEVTIAQWSRIRSLVADYSGDDAKMDTTYYIRLMSIMADIREDQAREITIEQMTAYRKRLAFIGQEITDKAPSEFKLAGNTYTPLLDLDDMTAGDYIDMTTYAENPEENLHEILALLTKGPGTQQERAMLYWENLTMNIAYPLMVFFYTVWSDFIAGIVPSLILEVEKMSRTDHPAETKGTTSTGGGTSSWTALQAETDLSGTTS